MTWERKREIRLRYDAEADGYDELYSDEQRNKYELALANLVTFNAKERVLDDGCGTGIFLENIARNLKSAIGVDLSSKALRKAQVRLSRTSNVHLVCADFDFLPFRRGTFNHIFMFTVLSAPKYWGTTIREVKRVLAKQGIMALSVPKRETSSKRLVRELKWNRLEPLELIDQKTTPDYIVICKRIRGIAT
jgi:ubiquinone/menaquinone biosynthesis C-methylase UbiE